MSGFTCPYCKQIMSITDDTCKTHYPAFNMDYWHGMPHFQGSNPAGPSGLKVEIYKCPNCEQYSVKIIGSGDQYNDKTAMFYPDSQAKQYPDYVPQAIRSDYEEAFSIISLSPKASATLSRRCLQGMIHDKWDINKGNLAKEIDALKDQIDPNLWKSIHALRSIGNIGAHMEKDVNVIIDVDEGEADKLLKLVEILIKEWYIDPHDRDELLNDIVQINTEKQEKRHISGRSTS